MTNRANKVYGFLAFRTAQVRCVVACRSMAELRRILDPFHIWPGRDYISVTGNKKELSVALMQPGVVFWQKLDDYEGPYTVWSEYYL